MKYQGITSSGTEGERLKRFKRTGTLEDKSSWKIIVRERNVWPDANVLRYGRTG